MTTTTRSTECHARAVVLYLAFELGSTKWTLGFTTAPAQRPRLRTESRRATWRPSSEKCSPPRSALACRGTSRSGVVTKQAGRDGFWLHRWLGPQGIDNVVVDSSSIEVNRKWRRAKTDRLDACKLLHLLMRWAGGERKVWSVVHVPSAAAEDDRQLTRELDTLHEDRTRVRNQIQALLATQGVRLVLDATFASRLGAVGTGDGRPFPAALRAPIPSASGQPWRPSGTARGRVARRAGRS